MKLFNAIATAAVVGASLVAATPVKACEYYMQMSRDFGYQADNLVEKAAAAAAKEDRKEFCSYSREYVLMSEKYNNAMTLWSQCLGNYDRGSAESAGRLAEMRVLMDKIC
jgi:hypothetical protein